MMKILIKDFNTNMTTGGLFMSAFMVPGVIFALITFLAYGKVVNYPEEVKSTREGTLSNKPQV